MSKAGGPGVSAWDLDASLAAFDVVFHPANYSRVQPYVLGGVGLVKATYSRDCNACVYTQDPVTGQMVPVPYHWTAQGSQVGVTLGFGLKVAVHRRFSIRSEAFFINTTPGLGWNWGWWRLQIGAGLHF